MNECRMQEREDETWKMEGGGKREQKEEVRQRKKEEETKWKQLE